MDRCELAPGFSISRVVTGLWQIGARHATGFDERLRLDIEYVRNMSFQLDSKILIKTIGSVAQRSGA